MECLILSCSLAMSIPDRLNLSAELLRHIGSQEMDYLQTTHDIQDLEEWYRILKGDDLRSS